MTGQRLSDKTEIINHDEKFPYERAVVHQQNTQRRYRLGTYREGWQSLQAIQQPALEAVRKITQQADPQRIHAYRRGNRGRRQDDARALPFVLLVDQGRRYE